MQLGGGAWVQSCLQRGCRGLCSGSGGTKAWSGPPRGLRSWLCQSIAAPRNSRLQALLKGSAGTRGFNCTLGILFSARPGIIYKNRKQKKQGERKNIKGLLNFHAAFEQAAFWIGSQPGASGKRAGAGS